MQLVFHSKRPISGDFFADSPYCTKRAPISDEFFDGDSVNGFLKNLKTKFIVAIWDRVWKGEKENGKNEMFSLWTNF